MHITEADTAYMAAAARIAAIDSKIAHLTDQFNRSRDATRRGLFATAIDREERYAQQARDYLDRLAASARREADREDAAVDALADLAADTLRCDDPDCGCND